MDRSEALLGHNAVCRGAALPSTMAILTVLFAGQGWAAERDASTVSLTAIPTACKRFAVAAGQRLQRPGKERTSGTGTLSALLNGTMQTVPIQIVWQYPQKVRIDGAGPTIVFDRSAGINSGQASQGVSDLLETLVNDSLEGLLALGNQDGAIRYLGGGYREKGANKSAPSYDVVQVVFADSLNHGKISTKAYWFDSATKLLAKVTYLSGSGGSVEVSVGNWQKIQGENIALLVERRENGTVTMRLALTTAAITAAAEDGMFGGN